MTDRRDSDVNEGNWIVLRVKYNMHLKKPEPDDMDS